MKGSGGLLALAVLLSACAISAMAQDRLPSCSSAETATLPCVDKVDPPDWFAGLPSPMLLLHGEHLGGARFTIAGSGISVEKSRISANGHYAFVWLATRDAAAQQIHIRVTTADGSTVIPFRLAQRNPAEHSGWSSSDVIYLIMTDRFADEDLSNDPQPSERDLPRGWHGGDFRGIAQHLDYLQDLGVTTIWTTPVYDNDGSPQAYHGYSATDLYQPDPHFGSLADYQHLAEAVHRRGMKLMLDTVPNHVGPAHPWAADPPTPDWFHGTRADHHIASDKFQFVIDPHAPWQQQRDVTEGWFANVLPDLNQENPLVKQYLIQNVIWWVETAGLDGLRYDTFPYVGRAFWQDLDRQLHVLYPQLTTVGEVFNGDPVITSYFAGGVTRAGIDTGLWTPFDFPSYFALRAVLSHHAPMSRLDDVLRKDWLYPHPERLVTFLGNHDTVRFLSQPGVTAADLKMGFALLTTMRGTPQIYSGDEIAMSGGADPDNRHDFPGGFPGDVHDAFTAAGRTPEEQKMHEAVRSLLHLRAEHEALRTGEQQDLLADEDTFAFVRGDIHSGCKAGQQEDRLLIVANRADEPRDVKLDEQNTALAGCTGFHALLHGQAQAMSAIHGTRVELRVAPQTVAIFQVQ